jgi:hypothetical protein
MKIKSIECIPIRPEDAHDRKSAIQNSWSVEDKENRHQIATELQLLLALIVMTSNDDGLNVKSARKRIRIDGPLGKRQELFQRVGWIDRLRNKQFDWELCPV